MMSINAYFLQIETHLLQDDVPSQYLTRLLNDPIMRAYPFTMLRDLRATEQSPKHHPEGNVWNHTLLVVDQAAKRRKQSKDPRVFMWSALLHDIGKPATTTRRRKGRITSYDHDRVGEKKAVAFLQACTNEPDFIRRVCAMVRYHMHILYITKKLPYSDIQGMHQSVDIEEIALLGLCDLLGRKNVNTQQEENIVREFLQLCKRTN